MHSTRLPALLFFLGLLLSSLCIVVSSQHLPLYTATHFGGGGQANGYMTRSGYRLFMLLFGVGLPLFVVLAISGLPRLFPHLTNLPYGTYWLALERRAQAQAILDAFGLWFGCALVACLGGVHWLVLQANRRQPPQLDNGLFLAMLGGFVLLTGLWGVLFVRRFRPPAG